MNNNNNGLDDGGGCCNDTHFMYFMFCFVYVGKSNTNNLPITESIEYLLSLED